MIELIALLTLQGINLGNWKVHLATGENPSALEAYLAGRFKEWQEDQSRKNFDCDTIVALIHHHDEHWLFGGAYRVLGVQPGMVTKHKYDTELLPGQDDLVGRVIVRYRRRGRASYLLGSTVAGQLEVAEIRESPVSIEPFPGYNNVMISLSELRQIVSKTDPSWHAALSSVNGIYLITDNASGRLYVGCAGGTGGIWQRWSDYAKDGQGGDIELISLL